MLGGRHEAAASELAEWWAGLRRPGTGSHAVLLAVPAGWGRTTVLDQLAAVISRGDAPVTLVARISGRSVPDGPGAQALAVRDCLMQAGVDARAAALLYGGRVRRAAHRGTAQQSVPQLSTAQLTTAQLITAQRGAGSLFASGLAAAVSLLRAGVAAARPRDDSQAGQHGIVARAARAAAAVSASEPVVAIIDDADCLEPGLAVTLIENLIEHHDSRVLVVAAVDPGGGLASALTSRARHGTTAGRVHRAAADPRMGYQSRADLAAELCPSLPAAAVQRIARRTRTFAEVFAIAGAGIDSQPR
ncbi:MAG: hypothetical protein ACLP70_11700 [Streptosporangiaceae bacterium]|jgi:hypothetical protein